MRKTRRTLLLAGGGALLAAALKPAHGLAQAAGGDLDDDPFPPLPPGMEAEAAREDFSSEVLDVQQLGTEAPTSAEQRIANEIINNAPYNCRPFDVALYFRDVGQGKFGDDRKPYVRGWPVRYNPVIVEFFKSTNLNPLDRNGLGDATAWCAAFVNWCIGRAESKDGVLRAAGLSRGSRSASSGSFRCWGRDAAAPRQGDVVVWAVDGTVANCAIGPGHVAFLEAVDGDRFRVIGGNQRDDTNRQAVTRKTLPRTFSRGLDRRVVQTTLHSIRSAEFL